MKKLYIVISSWDNYDDHYKVNECVCSSLFFAENKKTELENKYREEIPFPFDWIEKEDFERLWESMTTEDINVFMQWEDAENLRKVFNNCYINEVDYYEQN